MYSEEILTSWKKKKKAFKLSSITTEHIKN